MKSLHEYIIESINKALPPGSALNGRAIYLRGWGEYQRAVFEGTMKQAQRQFEKELPLLASHDDPP